MIENKSALAPLYVIVFLLLNLSKTFEKKQNKIFRERYLYNSMQNSKPQYDAIRLPLPQVHEKKDDLGRGQNEGSLLTGNAGSRLGCCTIGLSHSEKWSNKEWTSKWDKVKAKSNAKSAAVKKSGDNKKN